MRTTFETADLTPSREWNDADRSALVALLRVRPNRLTWQDIAAEVSTEGSARAVWDKFTPPTLFENESGGALEQAAADIESWQADGLGFRTFLDQDYPNQLRDIHEMPPVVFHRGHLVPDEHAVSVVGSRSVSERGARIAATIAHDLVRRGITVVSGLARGVDTAAHTSALEAGGRTVACIGSGITRYYPAENRALQDRIAREGLVLSQFWPDTPPRQQNFPMRNAVMSGYGAATVIVEAGEKSGARIQARQAVAHGRPVILTDSVVDANEWARNMLGRPGVHVADSTRDVMSLVEDFVLADHHFDDLVHDLLSLRGESRS